MIEVENSGLEGWDVTLWQNTCPSFDARYWDGKEEGKKKAGGGKDVKRRGEEKELSCLSFQ